MRQKKRLKSTRWIGFVGVFAISLIAHCEQPELAETELVAADLLMVSGNVRNGDSCSSEWTTVRCQSLDLIETESGDQSCVVGERRCVDGRWSTCQELQLLAAVDTSMSDGVSREGLLGTPGGCGGCDPECFLIEDCPSGADETDPAIEFDGVRFDGAIGGIVIDNPSKSGGVSRYAWISSHSDNVVNKLSLETLTNDGVYRTGADPSRTTVDGQGYVYVAARSGGTVTKITGDITRCKNTNATAGIQTSTGVGNLLGPHGDPLTRDECIIWERPVGPCCETPKAIAIDAMGRLWVGLTNGFYFVMNVETGDTIFGPIAVDHSPYGCAIGPNGLLWSADKGSDEIQAIDTTSIAPSDLDVLPAVTAPGAVRV